MKIFREKVRTTNEKRWAQASIEEKHHIKIRSKRNLINLPDDRDDIYSSRLGVRSWKNYRKTQWKMK